MPWVCQNPTCDRVTGRTLCHVCKQVCVTCGDPAHNRTQEGLFCASCLPIEMG